MRKESFASKLEEQILVGAFMLMLGGVLGNAMHGRKISQISSDVTIIKTKVALYHDGGLVTSDTTKPRDKKLAVLKAE